MTATIPTATATRTLHLVDLENLVGDPHANGDTAMDVLDRYLELAHWPRRPRPHRRQSTSRVGDRLATARRLHAADRERS